MFILGGDAPVRFEGDVRVDRENVSNCCVKSMRRFVVSPSLTGDLLVRRGVGDADRMTSSCLLDVLGVIAMPPRGVANSIVLVGLRWPSLANMVMSTFGISENVLKQVSSTVASSWIEKDVGS